MQTESQSFKIGYFNLILQHFSNMITADFCYEETHFKSYLSKIQLNLKKGKTSNHQELSVLSYLH